MERGSGGVEGLITRIRLLQRLMVAASVRGDQAELDRLANLMETETATALGLTPWFTHELVRGWTAHLPTGSPDPKGQRQ